MPPNETTGNLCSFADSEVTRLLASLIDFQNKSPDVLLEDDQKIISLVDELRDALSQVKVFIHGFVSEYVLTDTESTSHFRCLP